MNIFKCETVIQLITDTHKSPTTNQMITWLNKTLSVNYVEQLCLDMKDSIESEHDNILKNKLNIKNSLFISRVNGNHLFYNCDLNEDEQEIVISCIQSFNFFLKDEFIKKGKDCFVAIDEVFSAISTFCCDPKAQFVANLMHNRLKEI